MRFSPFSMYGVSSLLDKFNNVEAVCGHAVMGVEQKPEYIALMSFCVKCDGAAETTTHSHPLWYACEKAENPDAQQLFSHRSLSLVNSLWGTTMLNAEL